MKKFLVITIDVEPDCTTTWHYASPLAFEGVHKGIAEILHPLFIKYNIAPTYLINNVVIEDDASCHVLRNLPGKYELGTHLHPEFIEPMKTAYQYAGQRGAANCCEYPPEIEFQKLQNITRLFETKFGYSPVSFRAGRFSAGTNTINSLAKLGYLVDTSVTPHVCWNDKSRIKAIDYSDAPEQPYYIDSSAYPMENKFGSILEVPVSITTTPTRLLKELRRTWFGIRKPLRKKIPIWLRPAFSGYDQFVTVTENYCRNNSMHNSVVLNMMFHNVEVIPGFSPYTKSAQDCQDYLNSLERYFRYCNENNIEGITLSEVAKLHAKTSKLARVV